MRTLQVLLAIFCITTAAVAYANDNDAAAKQRTKRPAVEVTPKVEQTVLRFVRQHHSELAELLGHLRAARPDQYEKAIRDLARARTRLAAIAERDKQRYELEVKSWVLQSKIRLVVAKLRMADSDALRNELQSLLQQQVDLKITVLRNDEARARDRLAKAEELLAKTIANREESIDRQWRLLTRSKPTNIKTAAKSKAGGQKKTTKD